MNPTSPFSPLFDAAGFAQCAEDLSPADERFAQWLLRVEELLGHQVNHTKARIAYDCMASDPHTTPLTPEEYAAENPR